MERTTSLNAGLTLSPRLDTKPALSPPLVELRSSEGKAVVVGASVNVGPLCKNAD